MYPTLCTNTYHDISGLVNYGMVKNKKDLNISRMEHKCFYETQNFLIYASDGAFWDSLKTYIGFLPSF